MDIVTHGAVRAAAIQWQPRAGGRALTVICKATFDLRPDESPLAQSQIPPLEHDRYLRNDPRHSLLAASDFAPFKRKADVIITGNACAPGGRPTTSLTVRAAVGALDKRIDVHRDQAWTTDGRKLCGEPFVQMPIVWERAAWGPNNPVGCAIHARLEAGRLRPIPNLMPLGFVLGNPEDIIPVVGTGPIAPHWPSRVALLGRHAGHWNYQGWNTRPLPDDLDGSFFNAAPADQTLDRLMGDETIVLENLLPWSERLVTRLATVSLRVKMQQGALSQDVALRCDTLCIDAERGSATLVWRGMVTLASVDIRPRIVVVAEPAAENVSLRSAASPDAGTATIVAPFETAVSGEPRLALPFVPGAAAPPALMVKTVQVERPSPKDFGDGTKTMELSPALISAMLPFMAGARQSADAKDTNIPVAKDVSPPPLFLDEAAFQSAEEEPPTQRGLEGMPFFAVAPPPMIGPLASSIASSASAPEPIPNSPKSKGEAQDDAESKPSEPAPEPGADTVELTVEQTAAIAAELAEGHVERAGVFGIHGISEAAFRANETRWNNAIEYERGQGKTRLRGEYDLAYVARVEKFRGPITVDEYVRIAVGLKRGRVLEVLDSLRIQRAALMFIVRVWTKKVTQDVKLCDEMTKAIKKSAQL